MVSTPVRTQVSEASNSPVGAVQVTTSNLDDASIVRSQQDVDRPGTANSPKPRLDWGTLSLPASRLFGTDGIRGRAGDLLTPALALQLGFWAGQVLQNQAVEAGPVIIGQDSRNSSSMLAMALSAGLTAAVWKSGIWDCAQLPGSLISPTVLRRSAV
jgi:phosphoglucosamine mutase